MKILISPDKFKGSLSADNVAKSIAKGLRNKNSRNKIKQIPLADGGEGSARLIARYLSAEKVSLNVKDPLGRSIVSGYYLAYDGQTAIIEMASASGWELLSESERDPKLTNSTGTGELINDARKKGVRHIILCVGGSVTNDGGAGALLGMGYSLTDANGTSITPSGSTIGSIVNIVPPDVKWPKIRIAHDVDNPLLGPNGATHTYSLQKGAKSEDIPFLEKQMKSYHDRLLRITGRSLKNTPGLGAAGGIALSLVAFHDARLVKGFELMADYCDIKKWIRWADLVITGEGKLDDQSKNGKVVGEIEQLCLKEDKPLFIICGENKNYPTDAKVIDILSLASSREQSMAEAEYLLQLASESIL